MADNKYDSILNAYRSVLEEICDKIGINAHEMKFSRATEDPSIINNALYEVYHKGAEYSEGIDKHTKTLLGDIRQEASKRFFIYEKKPLSGYNEDDKVSKATAEDVINDIHTLFFKGAIDGVSDMMIQDIGSYFSNAHYERKYIE